MLERIKGEPAHTFGGGIAQQVGSFAVGKLVDADGNQKRRYGVQSILEIT